MPLFRPKARCQLCRKGKVKGFTQVGSQRIALTFCPACWEEIRSSKKSRGDAALVEELSRELDMKDAKGREFAAIKLGALRSPAAADALGAHLLKVPRRWTLQGLTSIGDAHAMAYVHQALCQQGWWWAKEKVKITVGGDLLGQSSTEEVYRRLEFEHVADLLSGTAIHAGIDGSQYVAQVLLDLLADPQCRYREDAWEELKDLLYRRPWLKDQPKHRDVLVTAARRLQQGDTESQRVAAQVLKLFGASH